MLHLVLIAIFCTQEAWGHAKKEVESGMITAHPPTFTCPEGYEPELDHCVQHLTEPMIPVCPEGILQPDGQCLVITPPTRVCPPEFALSGATCVRTATASATLSCPAGYVFEPGYKKSASVCTRAIEGPPSFVCPPNSVATGNGCAVESSILPTMSCVDGTQLNGSVCIRVEQYECQPASPPPTTKHLKKAKRMLAAEAEANDADYRQLGHKLKKIDYIPDERVEVQVVGQQCERRTLSPPVLQCPSGAVLVGRECIVSQSVPPIAGPASVTVDTAPPIASCPQGFTPCGGYKSSKKHSTHECCNVDEAPYTLTCQSPGFTLTGDLCQAFRPSEMVCGSSGFKHHKHKDTCQKTLYAEPFVTYTSEVHCVGDCAQKVHKKHAKF